MARHTAKSHKIRKVEILVIQITILLIIALLGVKLTLINKINELDCSVN